MITACILTCNELDPLKKCLASVKGKVSEIIVGVDSKTNDETIDYLTINNINHYIFSFVDFSTARNECISKINTDYYLTIDSDETLDTSANLFELIEKHPDCDAFVFDRHHWFDLENQRQWFPPRNIDKHFRLMKKHVRYVGKVHEQCTGYTKRIDADCIIHHYNLFYRTPQIWEQKNNLYKDLGYVS